MTDKPRGLPTSVDSLLKHLEEMYPPTNPRPGESLDVIFHRAGERAVVEYLLRLKAEQDEDPFNSPLTG